MALSLPRMASGRSWIGTSAWADSSEHFDLTDASGVFLKLVSRTRFLANRTWQKTFDQCCLKSKLRLLVIKNTETRGRKFNTQ